MDQTLLEKIGLTESESKIYIALLTLGLSSVGPIINKTGVARSKIYDVLSRLGKKGLVSYVIDGKIKKFNAVSPNQLTRVIDLQKQVVKDRQNELNNIIPVLNKIKPVPKTKAEILSGTKGIKAFFDMTLYENPNKNEVLFLGYTKAASMYFNAYFRDYNKKIQKQNIKGRVIYYYEAWFLKKRKKRKNVKQKYMHKDATTPAFIVIYGDTVGNIVFTPEQKLCFLIKNKDVAKSYKNYFEMVWKHSIKGK